MKIFHYKVPITPTIQEFLENLEKVRGKLTGGFQSLGDLLWKNADSKEGWLYLNDAIMGRAYRYSKSYGRGGWQNTHLPFFIREIEYLFRTNNYRRIQPPVEGGLFE